MTTSSNSEFLALCQAQVELLTKSLNAAWTVVYLTEDFWHNRRGKLNPIVVYPQDEKFWQEDLSSFLSPPSQGKPKILLLPTQSDFLSQHDFHDFDDLTMTDVNFQGTRRQIGNFPSNKQVMLPLIYQDSVMGLLITGRNDRVWNDQELEQIQNIANTLAIACYLTQRQGWYEEKLRQQQDRLDNLLHQLKNPITALRTFSKLLLKRLLPDQPNYPVAQGILQESNRLQDLVGNFQADIIEQGQSLLMLPAQSKVLTTSFLLTGNHHLTLKPILLEEIFASLILSFEAIAQEKEIKFQHNLKIVKGHLKSITGDSQALTEILSNLIDNALKYTPKKGSVYLELGLEQTIEDCNFQGIAIHDNGYGIPPQDQAHLFERHYRGEKETGDIPGTGLGLAIVKELVEQMGGKIEVHSPNLYFPLANLAGTSVIVWLLES